MMQRSLWTLAALALLVGCSGDKLLGPPDAPACTRGALVAGNSVAGTLSRSSCPVFSEWEYAPEYYESWTMPVQAGHAYLVHLVPAEGAAGDSLNAYALLYARNSGNDPVLSTASDHFAGTSLNTAGMTAQYLFFVAPENAAISIRVETTDTTTLGAYVLRATECPSQPLSPNDSSTGPVQFNASNCLVAENTDTLRFFAFPFAGLAGEGYEASMIIDSGAALGGIYLGGPSYDARCEVRDDCIDESASVSDSGAVDATPETPGQYVAFAAVTNPGISGGFRVRLNDLGPAPAPPAYSRQATRAHRRDAR